MKWQIRPKHPLKLFNLAQIVTGYSIYSSEWNCIGLRTSRAILRISVTGVGLACPPSEGACQIYHNLLYLKPLFNFLHVLKVNKDILSTFGALHLRTEIIEFEYCCKMVKNRCKSAKTSTKYWSIILKFGQKINWRILKSNCIGFRITSSIAVIIGVIYELQKACNWRGWGWVKMFSELA